MGSGVVVNREFKSEFFLDERIVLFNGLACQLH